MLNLDLVTGAAMDFNTKSVGLRKWAVVCTLLSLSQGASSATPEVVDSDGSMDNGDGTWSVEPAVARAIGHQEQVGAIVWEYVGQARYSVSSALGARPRQVETAAHWKLLDPLSQILGSRRYTEDGGEWVAVDVDLDHLSRVLDAAPVLAAEEAAAAFEQEGQPTYEERVWIDEESYWYEPHTWTNETCPDPLASVTYQVWNGEDWSVQGSADDWERAAVWILTRATVDGVAEAGTCGGVFVDDDQDWVLTAAHCLHDSDDNPVPNSGITVCALGNKYSGADATWAPSKPWSAPITTPAAGILVMISRWSEFPSRRRMTA